MFLPESAIIGYNYIKTQNVCIQLHKQIGVSVFTIVLIKELIKCDKFEFTVDPGGGDKNLRSVIYSVDLLLSF